MAGIQRVLLRDRIHPGLGRVLTTVGADFAAFTDGVRGPWLVRTQHASLGLVSATLTLDGLLGMVVALIAGQAAHSADRRKLNEYPTSANSHSRSQPDNQTRGHIQPQGPIGFGRERWSRRRCPPGQAIPGR
jgi:hypothetical protein